LTTTDGKVSGWVKIERIGLENPSSIQANFEAVLSSK
jgi:hypothetical protein